MNPSCANCSLITLIARMNDDIGPTNAARLPGEAAVAEFGRENPSEIVLRDSGYRGCRLTSAATKLDKKLTFAPSTLRRSARNAPIGHRQQFLGGHLGFGRHCRLCRDHRAHERASVVLGLKSVQYTSFATVVADRACPVRRARPGELRRWERPGRLVQKSIRSISCRFTPVDQLQRSQFDRK